MTQVHCDICGATPAARVVIGPGASPDEQHGAADPRHQVLDLCLRDAMGLACAALARLNVDVRSAVIRETLGGSAGRGITHANHAD